MHSAPLQNLKDHSKRCYVYCRKPYLRKHKSTFFLYNKKGEIVRNNMTSEISLEILDLIYPATISNYEFRTLWQKYNWENRIEVNTPFDDPVEFVTHLCNELKISVVERLTPFSDNKYLSANLYAKTYMGNFLLC